MVVKNLYCSQALNDGLHEAMEENQKVLFIGEDILDPYGGAFKVAKGLSTKFPDRVYPTPICEAAIVGIANGLALRGFVPVVEIMFGDFITLAFDQIINHLSKYNAMYHGKVNPHLVIRTPMGGHRGYGPTHSQSLEKFLIGIPNIKVLYPSHLHPIKNMLKKAINKEPKPVIFLENKQLYSIRNQTPKKNKIGYFDTIFSEDDFPTVTLSLCNFKTADVTFVCFGGIVPMVMNEAVRLLTEKEIYCELVILSQISPINMLPVVESVSRSKRIITVEEGTLTGAVGNEIITKFVENYMDLLISKPIRIAAVDDIIPSARQLEDEILPSPKNINNAVLTILNKKRRVIH
jgi:pyruvate/2-oxoglutarate/acetoin dehydrogenase E1 component